MTSEEVRQWPVGTRDFTGFIDDDGFDGRPVPISVAITVKGDPLCIGYVGSSAQVRGASVATATVSGVPRIIATTRYLRNSVAYLRHVQ